MVFIMSNIFKIDEYSSFRMHRGYKPMKMYVSNDGGNTFHWSWMDKNLIEDLIKKYGQDDELVKAMYILDTVDSPSFKGRFKASGLGNMHPDKFRVLVSDSLDDFYDAITTSAGKDIAQSVVLGSDLDNLEELIVSRYINKFYSVWRGK